MGDLTGGVHARRLASELKLADALLRENPSVLLEAGRFADGEDYVLDWRLRGTTFLIAPEKAGGIPSACEDELTVQIRFPRFFPILPLEACVLPGVFHPNACPMTGSVCLFDDYLPDESLFRGIAILQKVVSWEVWNAAPHHVVQPQAIAWLDGGAPGVERLPLTFQPVLLPVGWVLPGPSAAAEGAVREFLSTPR